MRKIFTTLLSMLAILSLVFTFLFTYDVLNQYEETMDWQQNTLYADIHKAPPNLAKNYIPRSEQELYVRLTDVNKALEEIEEDEKVDRDKIDRYWVTYSDANSVIKRMEEEETLPKGTSKKNLNRLHSYIQTEKSLAQAYEVVDIDRVEKLSQTFANRLNKEKNAIDRYYLNQLRELSVEYAELDQFSKEILNSLGIVENEVLQVDVQVNKNITENVLERIKNKNMDRFKHIRNLVSVLESDSWSKILSHNALTREYYSWKESEEILKALLHTGYKPVSEFETYEDVIEYDPTLAIAEREGYELDISSPVTSVYYHGEELDDEQYIKRGITLSFDIDYEFTEVEIEEEEEEPEEQEENIETPIRDQEEDNNQNNNNQESNTNNENGQGSENSERPRPQKPQVPQRPQEPQEPEDVGEEEEGSNNNNTEEDDIEEISNNESSEE